MNVTGDGIEALYHLTFYKAGSQWMRDILTDARIADYANHSLVTGGIDVTTHPWPQLQRGQLASPLYSASAGMWLRNAAPGNIALVAIRDPRDIVVSLVYSVSLSHAPTPVTLLLRGPLAEASASNKIRTGMFLFAQWAEALRSWRRADELKNVYLTRYESLVTDLAGELEKIFHFLKWAIPQEVISAVARDQAFERRTGRAPGQENQFSHRRKGIAGDWRNHFNQELGRCFEEAFPGLLTALGYESGDDWWTDLPTELPVSISEAEKRERDLLAVLREYETELAAVRAAAEERLSDVHILHGMLAERLAEEDLAHREVSRDPATVSAQTATLRYQLCIAERAAAERLADIEAREAERRELERSFCWRFGFQPLRALTSLFHR